MKITLSLYTYFGSKSKVQLSPSATCDTKIPDGDRRLKNPRVAEENATLAEQNVNLCGNKLTPMCYNKLWLVMFPPRRRKPFLLLVL